MPRPKRSRRVCEEPYFMSFSPTDTVPQQAVNMTVDEYEVIRLVDFLGKTHEECAEQMQVSRTTVTEIYESARRKLADVIVNGRQLKISGGSFRLCEGNVTGCRQCKHRGQFRKCQQYINKGENIMRIAVTHENGKIFQHFGHTEQFKIYDVQNGEIVSSSVLDTNGQGHGALSAILAENKVDALICGGIGGGAQMALAELGIKLYGGVSGDCDAAVMALAKNALEFNPAVKCSHHDHEHGKEEHTCGDHGCGKGNCNHGK